jgi:hypothetical protein
VFPTDKTVQQAYDAADLNRAVLYPTVSGAAIVRGNEQINVVANKVFGIIDCAPEQLVFTANSDTPYGPLMLDLGSHGRNPSDSCRNCPRVATHPSCPVLGNRTTAAMPNVTIAARNSFLSPVKHFTAGRRFSGHGVRIDKRGR